METRKLSFAPAYSVSKSGQVFKDGQPIAINATQFGGKKCEIDGKTYLVHRLVASAFLWMDINDEKTFVQHGDDNQQNDNVDNLSLGTNTSNTQDKVNKDRQHRPEWELNSQSKLTASDVQSIKRAATGWVKNSVLAKRYSVSEAQISRIVNNERW